MGGSGAGVVAGDEESILKKTKCSNLLSIQVIQGLVVEEFEFDDVAFFGEEFDDGDAAVLDVEVGHAGEGEVEEEAEDDADDAAVTEDDGAARAGL